MWFPWTPLVPTLIFVKTRRGLLVALVSPFSARGGMDASLASGHTCTWAYTRTRWQRQLLIQSLLPSIRWQNFQMKENIFHFWTPNDIYWIFGVCTPRNKSVRAASSCRAGRQAWGRLQHQHRRQTIAKMLTKFQPNLDEPRSSYYWVSVHYRRQERSFWLLLDDLQSFTVCY